MALFQLLNYLLIVNCLNALSSHFVTANDEEPVVFSKGATSLFIGHSFFVPVAKEFDSVGGKLKKKGSPMYPKHNVQTFFRGGQNGSPVNLWNNHKEEIETILQSNDIELFGMTAAAADGGVSDLLNAYKNWIDLALTYNSATSFFIGLPWVDFPSSYSDADAFATQIQDNADMLYTEAVIELRAMYPDNNIFYLNYGSIAGKMMKLFEQDELVGITQMIGKSNSIFRDQKGHGGSMLMDLAGLSWLSWFYGTPSKKIMKIAKKWGWNKKNVIHIFRYARKANKDYRLFETVG